MEVYESHLGGIYFDEEVLDYDYLYCEQCGDSDTHLGHADTWEEVTVDSERICIVAREQGKKK